ncbi:MAG: hypothetical protein IH991_25935 [Planctomycetes bacterium]|nr:hypothetical protein [Planctomycetota bacterium]
MTANDPKPDDVLLNAKQVGEAPVKSLSDVRATAVIYDCSPRHILRMADDGRIPAPVKLGSLVRWRLRTGNPMTGVLDHIEAGCPSCCEGNRR